MRTHLFTTTLSICHHHLCFPSFNSSYHLSLQVTFIYILIIHTSHNTCCSECWTVPPPHFRLSLRTVGVAASSFFTSGKYAIDPELRGAEFERIIQNLDVHFWKTFWNITETEVLSVSRHFHCFNWPDLTSVLLQYFHPLLIFFSFLV